MQAETNIAEVASSTYVIGVLVVTGIFAVLSALLIAWPALAYLSTKLV